MLARAGVLPTTREPRAMTRMPAASSRTGSSSLIGSRSAPARTRSGWATSANPVGGDRRRRRGQRDRQELGWPCYEGNEVQDEYKAELQIATLDLPSGSTRKRPAQRPFPGSRTRMAERSSRAIDAPPPGRRSAASPSWSMGLTPVRSGARSTWQMRLEAASGPYPFSPTGALTRSTRGSSCATRVSRSTCRSARTAFSTTSTSNEERSCASGPKA